MSRPRSSPAASPPSCRRRAGGWSACSQITAASSAPTRFRSTLDQLGARHTLIRAGRPQTNGAVEALHRLILEECWRPAFARYLHVRFTGLKRDLAQYVDEYNFRRVHNGRLTRGRIPADIVYGANKVKTR